MSTRSPDPDGRAGSGDAVTVHVAGPGTLGRTSRAPARSRPPRPPEPPPSRQRKRRTRLWMSLLLLTPVVLAIISLLTFATGGPPEPTVHPIAVPAGYYAVTDAYFGYAVPNAYKQNEAWTDQNADFFYGEPAAYVAETLLVTKTSPTPTTVPPPSLKSFGEPDPVPYSVRGGHRVSIPGTAFGYEEDLSRPGGYRAVALDTWERSTQTQMWLLIRAPAAVTTRVLASLRG